MNNENNIINNQTEPVVVPTTTPVSSPVTEPVIQPVVNEVPSVPVTEPVVVPQSVIEPQVVPITEPIVQPQIVPNTEPVVVPQPQVNGPQPDNNTMVNENLKKVEIKDYTPPSKLKIIILLIFFVLLVVFIIFLPDISSFLRNYNNGTNYQKEEKITTGKLVCSLETNTTDLDKEYEFVFTFTDSKLKKITYTANTRGDTTTESSMDELAEKCKTLKTETSEIDGFSMKCDYTENKLEEMQVFNLETLDTEKLTSAFTEAGGMLPSYKYDQEIDDVESNMKASGYTCERQK